RGQRACDASAQAGARRHQRPRPDRAEPCQARSPRAQQAHAPPPAAPARELVEPAAIAPDRARPDQAAGADVDARRLAPMRRTLAGPGSSPLLDSLEEDLKRLRARKRRDD
ncbi:MAG: hypothetical protein LC790_10530, partial [Actinobacteria bacterium]|nr:hypothetical protein [Actinomycetota bacterium]